MATMNSPVFKCGRCGSEEVEAMMSLFVILNTDTVNDDGGGDFQESYCPRCRVTGVPIVEAYGENELLAFGGCAEADLVRAGAIPVGEVE